MELRVSDIPAGGIDISSGADNPWMEQVVRSVVEGDVTSWNVNVRIEPPQRGGAIDASVQVKLVLKQDCDRCGEPIHTTIEETVELRYLPEAAGSDSHQPDEEIELGEDELDVGWYRDGNLSVADAVSEAVALALPMRSACEDTVGCDARTAKLLDSSAEQAGGHPGFAALKNWN